jgi:hypothetical protein
VSPYLSLTTHNLEVHLSSIKHQTSEQRKEALSCEADENYPPKAMLISFPLHHSHLTLLLLLLTTDLYNVCGSMLKKREH